MRDNYTDIYREVAKKLGLTTRVVETTYKNYWRFFRETIIKLPLEKELSEEEFKSLKTSFNVPSLGKLYITWPHFRYIRNFVRKCYENKENKALVQQDSDNM